jgi:plastocyanin
MPGARRTAPIATLVLCIGVFAGGTADAGIVKGTITLRGHALGSEASAADAVVVLHGLPGAPVGGAAMIDQRQHRFVPRVLAVTAGTTVEFPNHDDVHHNVYSRSPAQRFDLGLYPPGQTRSTVMERPGVVEIRCSAHPEMEAFVVVADGPRHSAVSKQGAYRIDDVPAGKYEIEVWHPDFEAVRRAFEMSPNTEVLSLDLDLRARRQGP